MISYQMECEECESRFTIEVDKHDLADEPQFCVVCANPISPIDEE